jgi:anti-anti-sigma regulatory factor
MSLIHLEGDVDPDVAALFVEQLAQLQQEDLPVTVDLSEAEVKDGPTCALLVDALRQTARRLGGLQVLEPPQVVAHGLYRVGALAGGTLHLVSPRDELGTAS